MAHNQCKIGAKVCIITIALCIITTSTCKSQQPPTSTPATSGSSSNPLQTEAQKNKFGALPEVTASAGAKVAPENKVGVHIPLVFDMTNSVGASKNQSRLDLSVLSGLVTVNKDRERDPVSGQVTGPVTVTVFGIPVYTGKASRPAAPNSIRPPRQEDIGKAIEARQAAVSNGINSATDKIQDTVANTNDRVIGTLSSIVDRLTGLIRRPLE